MKAKAMQPVLMIPLRRCGSHAIRLRLNFCKEFYSPYPLHIVDFMPLLPLYGDLAADDRYFQLCTDIIGLQALSIVKWDGVSIDPIRFFERIKDKPRSIHTVAWEILFDAAMAHGANVVMDKSLDNVQDWRELLTLYPHMLFINLVRDPRAQVSSMNRAIIHEFNTALNANIVLRAHEFTKELIKDFPSQVLTIRFEDFIQEEEITLKKLCGFLQLPFSKAMLDISRSEEAKRISKQSALWASNHAAPIAANIDKFKQELSREEIEQVESITSEIFDRFGYERMTAAKDPFDSHVLDRAKTESVAKRKLAWEKMREDRPQDFILRKRRSDYIELCKQNLLRR